MLTATQSEQLIEFRRDFHRHPELAHQEHRTAGIVAERLQSLGLDEVRTGVGQTGVVGVLRGSKPGKTVLLRADMDGLPLTETDRNCRDSGGAFRRPGPPSPTGNARRTRAADRSSLWGHNAGDCP